MLGVDPRLEQHARELVTQSLSTSTWRMTKTVETRLHRMELEHNICLEFPWSKIQLMNFVTACSMDGLKYATVQSYLSTVRRAHRLMGCGFSADGAWEVNMLLNGLKKSVQVRDKRVAVTPRILLTLKHRIKRSELTTLFLQ